MQTILLADDEEPLRRLICRILSRQGYRVLEAPDAEAALKVAAEHPDDIDLLITDINMPGEDGFQLYSEICRVRGDTNVLFISGCPDLRASEVPFLTKPFSVARFTAMVRDLVNRSQKWREAMARKPVSRRVPETILNPCAARSF
jgi:DNA-binding response OmpR family regulator